MSSYQTAIKKAVIQGITPRLTFQIVDEDGQGFQPGTLTMTIYDFACACLVPPTSSIVNEKNDIDVLANCDTYGNVEVFLEAEDTTLDLDAACRPSVLPRRILFRWTWDSPTKVGKHEVVITLVPDRELVAS
jgi:hypothetical protein